MPETQIFKVRAPLPTPLLVRLTPWPIAQATYSGVPVYEMMCKGVAVMRRRSDSWLNATQILKVAGFDKPQRTRVLEREVQKGEHEKVQGGYGKYQGTWIPIERGLSLARQYNCEHLLRPIIEFQPAAKSPPPAPKHILANNNNRAARRESSTASVVTARTTRAVEETVESEVETMSASASDDEGSMTPSPSEASSSSRTPSPIQSPPVSYHSDYSQSTGDGRRVVRRARDRYDADEAMPNDGPQSRSYCDQILEYFISDTNQIPQVLINPPPDFDPNMVIDDDGHTALHWACAMGRIRIAKLLLSAGADLFKVNKAGQTALMRSVMFANNYDVRKFPELYEMLHRSTLNIDNYNRTVFHHIVDVAMSKGKSHAARYYMETVLNRLADYPKELADVLNFQDEDGETALTMAARCRSKRLVKLLIDHGADPKIMNHEGKSTEDFILEDERFRLSPEPGARQAASRGAPNHYIAPTPGPSRNPLAAWALDTKPPLHYSAAAQRASTRCVNDMASMLDSLATSFDQELRDKERDMTQAQELLRRIQSEILAGQRTVGQLRTQADQLPQLEQELKQLQSMLNEKMGKRFRLGFEKWVHDEEMREQRIRDAAGGLLMLTPGTETFVVDGDPSQSLSMPPPPDPSGKGKRKAAALKEDISDLEQLYADIPEDPEALARACDALREEVAGFRKRRRTMFDELVKVQTEAGNEGRVNEYRRLIAAGAGLAQSEVDNAIPALLERGGSPGPPNYVQICSSQTTRLIPLRRLAFSSRRAMPRVRAFTTKDVLYNAVEATAPWTTNFRHMLPTPRSWLKRPPQTGDGSKFKMAPLRDRIKWWNIVPGDQVKVVGDRYGALREVAKINKLSNRVWLKELPNNPRSGKISYHYSRCRLFMGEFEFPPKEEGGEPRPLQVFAQRVGTTQPKWDPFHHRWSWQRFAVKLMPTVPHLRGQRIEVPWPKTIPQKPNPPGAHDTPADVVSKVTYEFPAFSSRLEDPLPTPPSEMEYLLHVFNPHLGTAPFGDSPPVERYLAKELCNPHGRAQKLKRFRSFQLYKQRLLEEYIRAELADRQGRSKGKCVEDARFKFKENLAKDMLAAKRVRTKNSERVRKMMRKKLSKAKKEIKQRKKLTALALEAGPNQVIPEAAATA
ncbi:hypothetical protein EV715DRAFT_195112 [Schizophyllum commune]